VNAVYKNKLDASLSTSVWCQPDSLVEDVVDLARSAASKYFKEKWGNELRSINAIKRLPKDADLTKLSPIVATFDLENTSRVIDVVFSSFGKGAPKFVHLY
jgi:hypothetical protein